MAKIQQLVLSDGTILPITTVEGGKGSYPVVGNRDYLDFYVGEDSTVSLDSLDAMTAEGAGKTDEMTLITDDVDANGSPVHIEAALHHYTYQVRCGKEKDLVSAETGIAPAVYQNRVHLVLAQRTYSEIQQEQTAAAQTAQAAAIAELSILVAGGGGK